MIRNKIIKIGVSSLLILLALWIATPKVYIHELLNHDHTVLPVSSEAKVKSQSATDCDFEKYNKPAYFNIFKFICSFIPTKTKSSKIAGKVLSISNIYQAISLLRGPPVTE